MTEVTPQRSGEHDDQKDHPPHGGAEGVMKGVDDGRTGVTVQTHNEEVVESKADEAV